MLDRQGFGTCLRRTGVDRRGDDRRGGTRLPEKGGGRDEGWNVVAETGYDAIGNVAIDATWSAVRFRPAAFVKRTNRARPEECLVRSGMERCQVMNGQSRLVKVAMAHSDSFPLVVADLKKLFVPYAAGLVVTGDIASGYALDAPASTPYPKGLFFGSVRLGKRYVSNHLMPVYLFSGSPRRHH